MTDRTQRRAASAALVVGSILGMAGTFAPTLPLRTLAWGLDGTLLVVGAAMLAVHAIRRGNDLAAAGFLVYIAGQSLILASAAMDLLEGRSLFAGGAGLWAASLALVSTSTLMPPVVRILGFVAAALFAVVALQMFAGTPLTALSRPLPFFAYPFLVATLFGWAWAHYHDKELT